MTDVTDLSPNRIIELDKLCQDQSVMAAAYSAGQWLMDAGLMRFPAPAWDRPAIVLKRGGQCVAAINYSLDADTLAANVDFAFCSPDYPGAFARLLLRLRAKAKDGKWTSIGFTCHPENAAMSKAVKALRAKPVSSHYRISAANLGTSNGTRP